MNITYNKSDIGNPLVISAIVAVISQAKHGGFMRVHGFKPKTGHGEIQDVTYCKGINYENAIKDSLKKLEEIEGDEGYGVTIQRGVWQNINGENSPTNRKSKDFGISKVISETYSRHSPEMEEALASIRKALTAPKAPTKEYEKVGNGVYKDENGTIFIRDLRFVNKNVIKKGDYPFSASSAVTAIKDEIMGDMPVGNYRQFRLDGEFDKISLSGIEMSNEDMGINGGIDQKYSPHSPIDHFTKTSPEFVS